MPKKTTPARKSAAKTARTGGSKAASSRAPAKKPSKKAPPKAKPGPARKPKTGAKVNTRAAKSPAKPAAKHPEPKVAAKPAPGKKSSRPEAPPPAAPEPTAAAATAEAAKAGRKSITVVSNKPAKKGKGRLPGGSIAPASVGAGLLAPGGPIRRPLIPSGPNAPAANTWNTGGANGENKRLTKSPFNKREITRFRAMLEKKRAQLVGDISTIEDEALRSGSGSLSNLPQHMADQGTDAYDQALSLDLAAADRRLIKEIDDALGRIAAGTYGICELSGRAIRTERLEELPWARYSIEAARELERRTIRP